MPEDHHDSFKYLPNENLCPDSTKRTEIDLERSCAINFFLRTGFPLRANLIIIIRKRWLVVIEKCGAAGLLLLVWHGILQ